MRRYFKTFKVKVGNKEKKLMYFCKNDEKLLEKCKTHLD